MTTFTGVHNTGIVLDTGAGVTNPVTIAAGAYISNNSSPSYSGDAVYGKSGTAWNVTNNGTIFTSYPSGSGIDLRSGGSVTNSATASIYGHHNGIQMLGGSGTVINQGTVSGGGFDGVFLNAGGSVINGHSGSSAGSITGGLEGIEIDTASGTVTNFGSIVGDLGDGVYLGAGGNVTNGLTGLITGYNNAVKIAAASGGVTNLGAIISAFGTSVYLAAGGSVSNGQNGSPTATISGSAIAVKVVAGAGTVTNFGTISAPAEAIYLFAGGRVTNGASGSSAGLITGTFEGVQGNGAPVTVANFGTIHVSTYYAVALNAGGSITNGQLGARITGGTVGAFINGGAGAVTNLGTISGSLNGVILDAGGIVTVAQNALVSGGYGVKIAGGDGTVVNSGAITGSGGTAVSFGSGDDLLLVDPGALFSGIVDGGSGANTIELRAGAATGTITGFGSSFVNFGHVAIDPGANWVVKVTSLAGTVINASGGSSQLVTQSAGAINLSGISGFPTIVLSNAGPNTISIKNLNFIGLTVGSIAVTGGSSFANTVNASTVTGTSRVVVTGGTGVDHLTGGAGNDTLNGGGGGDTLIGGAGNDTLNGGGGADTMTGGIGNDTYLVNGAGDIVTEFVGGGIDTIKTSMTTYTLGANVESLTYTGASNFTGTGNTLNNTIIGGSAIDTLNGGAGNDILDGELGNDSLTGGTGQDSFKFSTTLNGATNVDHIFDFSSIDDKILLSHSVFAAAGGLGTLAAGAFVIGAGAADAGDRIIYNSGTGALIYNSNGNVAGGATQFATLTTGLALTSNNFAIV